MFHFCVVRDSFDEDEDWHCGVVDRHGRGNFLIRYDERQDTLFTQKLLMIFLINCVQLQAHEMFHHKA